MTYHTTPRSVSPYQIILLAVVSLVMIRCAQDIICEDVASVFLGAGFYTIDQNGQQGQAVIDSLTIYGAGKWPEKIVDNATAVSRIELPMNPVQDTTTIIVAFPGEMKDSLIVIYNRNLNMVNVECGFSMFFDMVSISHTSFIIDSIVVVNNQITNQRNEHIKIFVPAAADL